LPFLNTFRIPAGLTLVAVAGAALVGGPKVGLVVALLAVLEISISFDNAIVNAAVLKGMTARWQQIFLTWGILIAVAGMRLVFPIVIVAAAAGLTIPDVVDQALAHPDLYAHNLKEANAVIASFGGIFLLMVFLDFFLDAGKDADWLRIERPLAGVGRIRAIVPVIAALVLLGLSALVASGKQSDVLVAGLAGLVAHLLASGIADRLEPAGTAAIAAGAEEPTGAAPSTAQARAAAAAALAKGGLASFLYLELLDASFSFDGVIGAFAISKDIVVIAVGLGLGALYIRTLTVYLVRQGVLGEYRYLEHGAHWAIGVLALVLFVGIEHHVPEVLTGLVGAVIIVCAFLSSIHANRKDARLAS
jgi:hypothetical protein